MTHKKKNIKRASLRNDTDTEPCQSCDSKLKVSFAPDPYDMEIKGDYTSVWLCEKCRKAFAEDI